MRTKKIRGHKKIWKAIKDWEEQYKNLNIKELKAFQRKYVKVWVSPYCDYDLLESQTPEPRGKTRELILESLINIYNNWKAELEILQEPYYLKIWLYEPNISKSQIVCALGNFIDFYESSFNLPKIQKKLNYSCYGKLDNEMREFTWVYAPDENALTLKDIGDPEEFSSIEEYRKNRKYIKSRMKRHFRKTVYKDESREAIEYFWLKRGAVWIGEK